jgi:hypothetical protein
MTEPPEKDLYEATPDLKDYELNGSPAKTKTPNIV